MLQVKGLGRILDRFRHIKNNTSEVLEESMEEAVLFVHSQVPPYPPPPEGSTYRRTMTLGRSITTMKGKSPTAESRVKVKSLGVVLGYIGTNVKYAPYVISRVDQAMTHKGRWYTLESVVEKAKSGINKIFRKNIRNLLKGK